MMSRAQETLLQGYIELQNYGLAHLKSSALMCATELGIPSAINRRGGAATIPDIITETGLNQTKLPCLRRLMRLLAVTGVFTASSPKDESETIYSLTPLSQLLVHAESSSNLCNMSDLLRILSRPKTTVSTFLNLEKWFRDASDMTPFEMAHGMCPWSLAKTDPSYNDLMNHASIADTNFTMDIIPHGHYANNIFGGLTSLVDVAGGLGAAAMAISRAFPHIRCSVLDLEHVISKASGDGRVKFIASDMFNFIPPADAVLLKTVLNSWDDDSCVKILKHCKTAIPQRDDGGKVIIINLVVGYGTPDKSVTEAQLLLDLYIMRGSGFEREERQWKKNFFNAGFSDYKIMPILGPVSIIEVFP